MFEKRRMKYWPFCHSSQWVHLTLICHMNVLVQYLLWNNLYQDSLLLRNILYKDSLLLWNILYKDSLLNGKENSVKPETLVNPETCHGVFCVMIILVSSQQTLENLKHKHLLNLLNQSISPEKTKCKDIFCLLCFMTCLSKHLQLY